VSTARKQNYGQGVKETTRKECVNLWIILNGEIQGAVSQTKTNAVCRSETPLET
jgi:hypothetical protein